MRYINLRFTYLFIYLLTIDDIRNGTASEIAQRDEFNGKTFEQSFKVPQHEVVARVPQSVAVDFNYPHRHDAFDHFLADCSSRHEDHSV